MKTLKFKSDRRGIVTRELISTFGETLYQSPEVNGILIRVSFKDGSCLSFKRREIEDKMNNIFEEEE